MLVLQVGAQLRDSHWALTLNISPLGRSFLFQALERFLSGLPNITTENREPNNSIMAV